MHARAAFDAYIKPNHSPSAHICHGDGDGNSTKDNA